jgi:hypothetical protein
VIEKGRTVGSSSRVTATMPAPGARARFVRCAMAGEPRAVGGAVPGTRVQVDGLRRLLREQNSLTASEQDDVDRARHVEAAGSEHGLEPPLRVRSKREPQKLIARDAERFQPIHGERQDRHVGSGASSMSSAMLHL